MTTLVVPDCYGYTLLVALSSILIVIWMSIKVGFAREKFGVKYPTMYSADNDHFNCYQRAHQNTLEVFPIFITLLLVGGLYNSTFGITTIAGIVWCVSRIMYARGYYTGNPEARVPGAMGSFFALVAMLYQPIMLAGHLLEWF